MTINLYKFLALQLAGGAVFVWAAISGYLDQIYLVDVTYLTYVITALGLAALVALPLHKERWARKGSDLAILLGLIGTFVGLLISLDIMNLDLEKLEDDAHMLGTVFTLLTGIRVAITTTIVGSIAFFWVHFTALVAGYELRE